MNQPPAFQFYVDNFVQGTCDMEPAEVGVYIRLLCYQWSNGAIPAEKGRLFRVAGGEVSEHVLAKFRKGPDGMLRNERMERERAKQIQFRQKQAEFGKTGGRPRKGSLSKAFPVEKGFEKGSQSPPSPSPSPSPVSDPDLLKEAPSASPPVSSEHQAFIKGWTEQFKAQFGSDYQFDRGRDGKAVKELMQMSIARIDVLEIAKKAWARGLKVKSFNCEKASTIHGFRQYFNDIQVEVKHGHTHQQLNKRNIGVAGAGQDDYAAAARRKVERQMAQTANQQPPQTQGNGV